MKKYFLHNGTENSGPFDLDELRTKRIIKTTPVWHEGLEDWKTAGEIEELRSILIVVPPPIRAVVTAPPIRKMGRKPEKRKILGLSKTTFFWAFVFLVLVIGTFVFNIYQENRSEELEQKNKITERENQQYVLQQKEIEDQKILLDEQEKAEAVRLANERKHTISNRLVEIKNELAVSTANLEDQKNKLNGASDFKILRTSAEKNEQISLIQKDIEYWQNEIDKLKKETDQLNLELEKVH
jgi:hypothetical protein